MKSQFEQNSLLENLYVPENRRKINHSLLGAAAVLALLGALMAYQVTRGSYGNWIVLGIMGYSSLSFLRMLFYALGSYFYELKARKFNKSHPINSGLEMELPLISILVPAYNEGPVIEDVIKNYQVIDYPNYEVIIVDDGSADDTFEKAWMAATLSPLNIQVYTKANGGKASALNFALEKARGEYVLCMDADSTLGKNTLRSGIRYFFENPNLAAVAGVVKVENTETFIGKMQYLDYLFGHFQRKGLSLLKVVTIVPGPIGLFRRDLIEEVGSYESENTTYAEDTELTFRLITSGYDIVCDDEMIAYTEAPSNYRDLYRQRYRWTRGIYQALLKNTHNFIGADDIKYQKLFMYLLWEQVLFPVIDFILMGVFVYCFMTSQFLEEYSLLFLYIFAIDLVMTFMATSKEKRRMGWLYRSIIARFFYTNVILVWKMTAFYDEWVLRGMSWDKLSRTGFSSTTLVKE